MKVEFFFLKKPIALLYTDTLKLPFCEELIGGFDSDLEIFKSFNASENSENPLLSISHRILSLVSKIVASLFGILSPFYKTRACLNSLPQLLNYYSIDKKKFSN